MHHMQVLVLVPIVAHQGGWDEALLVGLPLGLIGLLLWVANRRVSAQLAETAANGDTTAEDTAADEDTTSKDTPSAP